MFFLKVRIVELNAFYIFSITWDTRLVDIFGPDFRLSGEFRTSRITIRDVLSHKVGWAQYAGGWMMGFDSSKPRQDYCR